MQISVNIRAKIIAAARAELDAKHFGVTQQVLSVHRVAQDADGPRVVGVDTSFSPDAVHVFFALEGESYQLRVKVNAESAEVEFVAVEPSARLR